MTRYLLYSHDTYGLGHFRRTVLIASGLVGAHVDNEVLIVTGSPRAESFQLPDRVDTVKLPTVTKDAAGGYRPRKLQGAIGGMIRMRSSLIAAAAASFEPDVIMVDHAPVGMGGELVAMLDAVARLNRQPRRVLGIRDIIDDPRKVDSMWQRDGVWDALGHYDDIFVYGDPHVLTTAMELGLDRRVRARVTHTGYVAPAMPEPLTEEPFLLVTAGGGGDGQPLLRRFLDAAERGACGGLRALVVSGPLLSAGRRAELLTRAETLPNVEIIDFSDQMRLLIASAAGVISMAGYNTVVEELAAGTPSLLVPRCRPRLEQHLRASRVAPVSHLEHCPLETLTTVRIGEFVESCQDRTQYPVSRPLDLSGASSVVSTISTPLTFARTSHHE